MTVRDPTKAGEPSTETRYCEECGDEVEHTIDVELIKLGSADESKEPHQIFTCTNCGREIANAVYR